MNSQDLDIIISATDKATAELDNVAGEIDKVADSASKSKKGFEIMESAITGLFTGALLTGLVGIGGIIGALGGGALDVSGQFNQATREIQGQLGVTEDKAKEFADVALQVFGNNFGDSVLEAKEAVVILQQQIGELGNLAPEELQTVAEQAYMIKDAFGVEIAETANATKALMENFGVSATDATTLIASGFQQGLNSSNDFLDSVTEYANQFSEGGASAEEFFNFLDSGLSTGLLGTDKAADLFKEFVVRIQDGSKLTADSLEMIGINSEQLLSGLANGTIEPIDAFNQVQEALRGVDDESVLMQAGVGLLGTQFEDLGASTVLAIDSMNGSFEANQEVFDQLGTRYESFGSLAQGVWRDILIELKPFTDELLRMANDAAPYVIEAIGFLIEKIKELSTNEDFIYFKDVVWKGLMDYFEMVSNTLIPFLQESFSNFMTFFENELSPLIEEVWTKISQEILPTILPTIQSIMNIFIQLWGIISWALGLAWPFIQTFINFAVDIFTGLWKTIQGVIQIIEGILTGDLDKIIEGAKNIFRGLGRVVKGIFDGIVSSIKNSINLVIDSFNSLIDKIPELPGGGKPPKIPRLARGGSFETNGPMMLIVGDNPGGRERVDVTPTSSPNFDGPKGAGGSGEINININLPNALVADEAGLTKFVKEIRHIIKRELKIN